MKVRDVLASKGSHQIYTVRSEATVQDLLDALADHNVGALIVSADGETLEGVVSERDIVRKLRTAASSRTQTVASIMTPAAQVRTLAPEDSFHELMSIMTELRVRHVPIVEEDRLVGMLSIGDAVKHRMEQLEFERDQLSQYVAGG